MASTYLSKTFSSADSSGNGQKKFTVSVWLKRGSLDSHQDVVSAYKASNGFQCDAIRIYNTNLFGSFSHSDSGGSGYNVRSNAVLKDTNAWYHLVTAVDTTQNTASDRVKLYINGEQVTSLSASTYPAQNESLIFGMPTDAVHEIGAVGTSSYFDGVMSHVHICFNQQYDASAFGETDSTTGEWKIKTSPSVSYGSIGGWYLKDEANGTDYSSNSNTYAVNGLLTKTEDNPSNVFCTMNPLNHDYANTDSDIYYGNTLVYPRDNTNYTYAMSTMAMPKGNGKFYFEAKFLVYDDVQNGVGIVNMDYASDIFYQNRQVMSSSASTEIGRVLLNANGRSIISGTENSSYGFGGWSNGDIICMACDMENGAFYFRKNGGSWANSGDPTSGSTKTGAIDISSTSQWTSSSNWGVWCGSNENNNDRFAFNFGNGSFGNTSGYSSTPTITSTAVSSAGTNASGIGIFEFDVPAGYTALSTKGLNL